MERLVHIEKVIEAQGRRMDWLADRVGITPGLLTHVIAGRRTLQPEVAVRIAAALGLPLDYVVNGPTEAVPA